MQPYSLLNDNASDIAAVTPVFLTVWSSAVLLVRVNDSMQTLDDFFMAVKRQLSNGQMPCVVSGIGASPLAFSMRKLLAMVRNYDSTIWFDVVAGAAANPFFVCSLKRVSILLHLNLQMRLFDIPFRGF